VRFRRANRTDAGTAVKFVPLSANGTTSLSLGGRVRVTYERFGNQSFGLTPPDRTGISLQRPYLLHTDLRAGSRMRVWTEFNSGSRTAGIRRTATGYRRGQARSAQAFVDVAVAATSPSAAILRVGAGDAFAPGRMYALREDRTSLSASMAYARLRTPVPGGSTAGQRGRWTTRPCLRRRVASQLRRVGRVRQSR